ncbi:hypothetical protein MAA_08715 [Metarhizium robertsii ARSEF 23]|uniref:DUF3472 domain protein n=1 Tax=Metarhizium robertsii (strain ARSEF 23 / ATCC MYA-3075) TaxID=655844 RepID=E9F8W6_METRA|nr:uncharacterized protein MAA_08715 [Metarhizium robertsii ARSEF 23]EFY95907.1 hypothetical protein MAA_08715 [Metarhizium robertsii ARSEF 23]
MKTSPLMLAGLLGLAAADPIKKQQASPTPAPKKTTPGHLVRIPWKVDKVPSDGLQDITFHISMKDSIRQKGWYFAQNFDFYKSGDAYIGVQPRPANSKGPADLAAFSSFVPGTTSTDPNCRSGADRGPGVTCAVQITGTDDHSYDLRVENIGNTTWRGTMVNTVSKVETHIGSWTLPAGAGGVTGEYQGFVEWWPFNDRSKPPTCNLLNRTTVAYGPPRTSTANAGAGRLGNLYETFECTGKINYKTQKVGDNVEISVGF